jgi:hypothetical protein
LEVRVKTLENEVSDLKRGNRDLNEKYNILANQLQFIRWSEIASISDKKFIFEIISSRMKKSVISFILLYRGTDCKEWTHAGVHSRVDNRGPTVVLMKIKQTGRRCGGFTSVSWDGTTTAAWK